MDELGQPIAYLALPERTTVYDRSGQRIGVVEHILADESVDIFHGLIVHIGPFPGRHRFADADQIVELHEHGVLLSVGLDELHDPNDDPAAGAARPPSLAERLRYVMEWLSGRP